MRDNDYKPLPPLEPFHALFRSIRLIGNKSHRSRISEAVWLHFFTYVHIMFAPFVFFCLWLKKILNKCDVSFIGGHYALMCVLLFIVILVLLICAKYYCAVRRFNDCGLPSFSLDGYKGFRKMMAFIYVGNKCCWEKGIRMDVLSVKSPKYVYVGTPEAKKVYRRRYILALLRECTTFLIGSACIAGFYYLSHDGLELLGTTSANVEPYYKMVDAEDVLGKWVSVTEYDTVTLELKEKDGRISVALTGSEGVFNPEITGVLAKSDTASTKEYQYTILDNDGDYEFHRVSRFDPVIKLNNDLVDERRLGTRYNLIFETDKEKSELKMQYKPLLADSMFFKNKLILADKREDYRLLNFHRPAQQPDGIKK